MCVGSGTQCSAAACNHKAAGASPGFMLLPLSEQKTSIIKHKLSIVIVLKSQKHIAYVSTYVHKKD